LLIAGNRIYGLTRNGGSFDGGVAFAMDLNGNNFDLLHDFSFGGGNAPMGSLVGNLLSPDGHLLGMTKAGGMFDAGTIFSMDADGGDFRVLYNFDPLPDGANPWGNLFVGPGGLYGMTKYGGTAGAGNLGVMFKLQHAFPEPATMVSGLIGLLGLAGKKLMRKKKIS